MATIHRKTVRTSLQNKSATCFGISSTEKAGDGGKRPWTKGNHLSNIIPLSLKSRPLFCKAGKQAGGGCSCRIKNLLHARTRTTCWPAAMKFPNAGYALRSVFRLCDYQIFVLSFSGLYILSPGFTSKA